jgi:hypothetical protein
MLVSVAALADVDDQRAALAGVDRRQLVDGSPSQACTAASVEGELQQQRTFGLP